MQNTEVETMSDNERKDFLVEFLTTLYRIAAGEDIKESLDYETQVLETRLNLLGVTNLDNLKPTKK